MSIMRKMIFGYVILIFIPVIVFGYLYYSQIYNNLTKQFVESRQKILEQAYANLKTDFTRIQSVQRMLQYNPYVTDYLDGIYQTDAENVYVFLRYIRPLYTQLFFAHPEIKSIEIYNMKDDVFPIPDHFLDRSQLDPQREEIVRDLKAGSGIWVFADSNTSELIYYQYLYNTQYTERIGLLEMRVSSRLIADFYKGAGVEGNWAAVLLPKEGEPRIANIGGINFNEKTLRQLQAEESPFSIDRKTIINQLEIDELGVRLFVIGEVHSVFQSIKQREQVMVMIIVLLLLVLSVTYYMLATNITKRILRLARHMRNLDDENLKQRMIKHDRLNSNDEIGFLTETYNTMLQRMDELINNVHRAELRNKEAAYKVLQAQIKPHFLYNTLETIRMIAESNNDKEVADISFWFGRLMRYSLTSEQDVTVLEKEIEMVTFYLNIHQMRLQSRLTYEIDVAVNADSIVCPRFILQPLIENSVIHGASAIIRPVHIRLHASEDEREIRIVLQDNGNGISAEKLAVIQSRLSGHHVATEAQSEGGVGLMNVNERIKSFFGGDSRIEISSEPGKGTSLWIFITKRMEANDENIDG
ncbi:histidine kinase [Paenibacillus barengoltzii]|uniref:sensor histidine kinase n=1 Tax=Paenibacillus barengoltzii TaxID=343517 RepID=UPI002DBC317F|nr:histidine kinase [Paenibacillus barengoltzii]MEC2344955.1 histidine kinase [Paenibacillus barengoltzii]